MVTFTALIPTLHTGGETPPVDPTELAFTQAVGDGDSVPISDTMMTIVFIKNKAASTPYDVTMPANIYTELAGGAGEDLTDAVITVAGSTTMLAGVFMPYRFANVNGYGTLTYDGGESDISVAVVHVPYTSK